MVWSSDHGHCQTQVPGQARPPGRGATGGRGAAAGQPSGAPAHGLRSPGALDGAASGAGGVTAAAGSPRRHRPRAGSPSLGRERAFGGSVARRTEAVPFLYKREPSVRSAVAQSRTLPTSPRPQHISQQEVKHKERCSLRHMHPTPGSHRCRRSYWFSSSDHQTGTTWVTPALVRVRELRSACKAHAGPGTPRPHVHFTDTRRPVWASEAPGNAFKYESITSR